MVVHDGTSKLAIVEELILARSLRMFEYIHTSCSNTHVSISTSHYGASWIDWTTVYITSRNDLLSVGDSSTEEWCTAVVHNL